MADTTVTARFRADTSDLQTKLAALQTQMAATQKKFASTGQAMMGVGKSLTMGVTVPIAAVGTAAVVAGASFEKSMNKVRAVSGATGSDFTAMSDTAKELGRTTAFSASQAADGMSFLAMAGFEANDIVSAMPGVLNLAAAGQMDLAEAADIASNVLTGFGKGADELDSAVDVMAKTFTSANTSLGQLGEAMSYVAPIAASAGADFEETSAAIGLLGNAGIQGSRAGTSLARVMSILTMNSSKTAGELQRLGVSALDSSGNLLPLNDIIRQLEDSGATTADIMSIFGQRAGPAMAALISQGSDALTELTGDLEASGGTAEEIADTQMEGLAGSMLRLKSAFEGAMIAIAESGVLDALTKIVESAAGALSKFTSIWERVPGPVKSSVLILGAFVAALGPVMWAGGKLISMLGSMMGAWSQLLTRITKVTRSIGTRVKTMELEIKTAMIKTQTRMGAFAAAAGVMGKKVILAFRTIGAAAKGLVASLGPAGIAIAALSLGIEIFMGRSMRAQGVAGELRQEIDKVTGAFTDAGVAAIAFKLRQAISEDQIKQLDEYGISVGEMASAIANGGDELDAMNSKMNEFRNAHLGPVTRMMRSNTTGAFKEVADGANIARKAFEDEEAAARDAGIATSNAGDAASSAVPGFQDAAAGLEDIESAADEAKTQMQMISDMFTIFDANVAAIRAKDEANAYMRGLDEALGKVAKNLLGESKAAQRNRDVVLGAFEAKKRELTTWAEATGATTGEVATKWAEMTTDVQQQLIDEGIDAAQLKEFLGEEYIDVASVAIAGQLEDEMGYIGSTVGSEAKQQGTHIGTMMANGLVRGITGGIPPMERAAREAARAAEAAVRNETQTRSPSKVFEDIGYDLMDGLKIGIEGNTDWVGKLGEDLTDRLARAIESGEETIYQAAKGSFVDWYVEIKDGLEQNLNDAQGLFDDFAEGIQSSLMGGIDLGAAFSGQFGEAGASTGVSLLQGFRNQVAQADWAGNVFQAVRNQALAGGASQQAADALTQALAAEGPAIGGAIGQQILDEGMAVTMANEYQSVLDATRAVGEALMPEHLLIGRNNAQAEYSAWVERMGPGGDLRKQFLTDWRAIGVETSQEDYEGMRDALKAGGPVGDAIMNLFNRLGKRSAKSTADKFSADIAGSQGNRMRRTMDSLAASLNRTAKVTVYVEHVPTGVQPRAKGGPVSANQAYLVGERGPEIFMPGASGNVIPNKDIGVFTGNIPITGNMSGGGGNVTNVNVNVNAGMGADGAEVGRQVVEAIRKYERRSGPVFASA